MAEPEDPSMQNESTPRFDIVPTAEQLAMLDRTFRFQTKRVCESRAPDATTGGSVQRTRLCHRIQRV